MREIKFRGREQDGFWTYGDLRHEGNITGIIENGIYSWVDSSTVGQHDKSAALLEQIAAAIVANKKGVESGGATS